MTTNSSPDHLVVSTPQGEAGMLFREADTYYFQYHPSVNPGAEICLNMPFRARQYSGGRLFPLFEMNLPEGYVLEQLRNRFAKAGRFDPMLLLALTGHEAAIGRITVTASEKVSNAEDTAMSLKDILAWNGTEDLFAELAHRYLRRTGVSGVQPKLLVPGGEGDGIHGKGLLTTRELIVKSAGDAFPGLAINEFVCMSIAGQAGIPVPEFYLSENRQLFVMRRFDRTPAGEALGFEDMTVLMGRSSADKYKGSYSQVARALEAFCSPQHTAQALAQLFDQVALSCMIGNGDAHLKNFGVLYTHPSAGDVRMAPAYDLVNTTCYIPEDGLALSMKGTRGFYVARVDIAVFADDCGVARPRERLRELVEAGRVVLDAHRDLLQEVPAVEKAIRYGLESYEAIYG